MPKPGYGSYGLVAKAATLPVSGVFGGPLDFVSKNNSFKYSINEGVKNWFGENNRNINGRSLGKKVNKIP